MPMSPGELAKFVARRATKENPVVFGARCLRYGIIGSNMQGRLRSIKHLQRHGANHHLILNSVMELDPRDTGVSCDLILDGIREPLITQVFRKLLKPEYVCYDLGANIGYYALQEAKLCRKVYAVEPVPANVERLKRNIALNNYRNIEVEPIANGDTDRTDTILISPMSNMCSLVKNKVRTYQKEMPVKVKTLDSFMVGKPPPDVLRMDVEGYEWEIIQGAHKFLQSGKPCLMFIEVHCDVLQGKVRDLARWLKDYGFHIKAATYETHASVKNPIDKKAVAFLERIIGAQGYLNLTMDDLIKQRKYASGQIEWLEVIFERN